MTVKIHWPELQRAAALAMANAYAPYSDHPVGAAGLCTDGTVVVGCNVENANYLAIHAEWAVEASAAVGAHGALVALVVVQGKHGALTTPCGICREILAERSGPSLLLKTDRGVERLADVLPHGAQRSVKQRAGPPSLR